MNRARLGESLLAALGTLAAAWPLTTLLSGGSWLWLIIWLVLLVAALGAGTRALRAPRDLVLLVQIVAVLTVVAVLGLHDIAHWHEVIPRIGDLVADAHHTVMTSAPPAPVTPGLRFVLALVVPVLAIATDYLAVTRRNPAAAGIPLLGVFMLSASNHAAGLNPLYFVAIAIVWLSMLAHGTSQTMRGWASTFARPATPTLFENHFATIRYASRARVLGATTLALALIVPAALPHNTPVLFGDGLGTTGSGSGNGHGGATMFGSEADIARDLKDQGTDPVLTFRTKDPSPPPLRVLTTSSYRDGHWDLRRPADDLVRGRSDTDLHPDGISTTAKTSTYRLRVTHNEVRAPQLAAPFPTIRADLGDTDWRFDQRTGRIRPENRPGTYSVTYEVLGDDVHPNGATSPPPGASDDAIPDAARDRVVRLARSIGGSTPFDQAIAIQDYLRGGDFTYSLKLAKTRIGEDGEPLDPLSNFLVTKVGYCTQFATAMVMLARADGIPARLAVGFLPGEQGTNGAYHVVRSDAHAWPELWFPGMGWTRFEPTPGTRSGAPPLYAIQTDPGALEAPSPSSSTTRAVPQRTQQAPPAQAATPHSSQQNDQPWRTPLELGLIVLAILLVLLVLPTLARLRRRKVLRSAHHPAEHVEAEWTVLQWRLDDLGIDIPDGRSPRACEDYYRHHIGLPTGRREDALHAAVQQVEAARYAPPTSARVTGIGTESAAIVRRAHAQVPVRTRLGALLWPRTARRAVRRRLTRIRSVVGRDR